VAAEARLGDQARGSRAHAALTATVTMRGALITSCMNSRLQSTQEFWYRKLGIELDMHGPWFFG